jgi:hypothetical protein
MNTSRTEKTIKEIFLGTCWEYLRDNFHKFSEANKIKIALTLAQKDVPQEMKGDWNVTQMPVVKLEDKPLSFGVGNDPNCA